MPSTPSDHTRERALMDVISEANGATVELAVNGDNILGQATVNERRWTVTIVEDDGDTWTVRGDAITAVRVES